MASVFELTFGTLAAIAIYLLIAGDSSYGPTEIPTVYDENKDWEEYDCDDNEISTTCGSRCDTVDACRTGQPCPYYYDTGCYPDEERVCNCIVGYARVIGKRKSRCVPSSRCKPLTKCPRYEILTTCGHRCDHVDSCTSGSVCPYLDDTDCFPSNGTKVCNCRESFYRYGVDGRCVSARECQGPIRCSENEILTDCGSKCDSVDTCTTGRPCPYYYDLGCYPTASDKPVEVCNCDEGYRRASINSASRDTDSVCEPEKSCIPYNNCPVNEFLTSCGSKCDHEDTCLSGKPCPYQNNGECFPPGNQSVCNCIPGYFRIGNDGLCVTEIECLSITKCPVNEIVTSCGSKCDTVDSCRSGRPCPFYDDGCHPHNHTDICNCKPGFARDISDPNQDCVPRDQCKPYDNCPENEYLTPCGSRCDHVDVCTSAKSCPHIEDTTCYPAEPDNLVCNCIKGYYRLGANGHCVPDIECRSHTLCQKEEQLTNCGSKCDTVDACSSGQPCPYYYHEGCYPSDGVEVCNCKPGLKRRIKDGFGVCVSPDLCEPINNCPANETLTQCGSKCDHVDECFTGTSCPYTEDHTCYPPEPDSVVCNCIEGYSRLGPDGHCIPDVECRSYTLCQKEEQLTNCGSKCDTVDACSSGQPCPYYYLEGCYPSDGVEVCNCKPGLKRRIKDGFGVCVSPDLCEPINNCPANETLTQCGSKCDHVDECITGTSCPYTEDHTCYPPEPDSVVCNCIEGYSRLGPDGHCIPDVECRSYTLCQKEEQLTNCGSKCDTVDACSSGQPCPYYYHEGCYPSDGVEVCNCKPGLKRRIKDGFGVCVSPDVCEPINNCPANETLTQCGSKCDHVDECFTGTSCPYTEDHTCYPPEPDSVVCNCIEGYSRLGPDGHCIPDVECRSYTRCKKNEILTTCGSRCDPVDSCMTGRPCPYYYDTECYVQDTPSTEETCNCKQGFKRVVNETESSCVPRDSCKEFDDCPANEILTQCGSKCDHVDECVTGTSCPYTEDHTCYPPEPDSVVCNCIEGYFRSDGHCITDVECRSNTRCKKNEILTTCGSRCDPVDSCMTGRPCPYYYDTECYVQDTPSTEETCNCKQGFKRVVNETESSCVPRDSCKEFDDCPEHEVLTECGSLCDHTDECLIGAPCPHRGNVTCYPPEPDNVVCNCIEGYFRRGNDGPCIPDDECRIASRGCTANEFLTMCGSRCDQVDSCSTGRPCPYYFDKECFPWTLNLSKYEVCNCKPGFKRVINGTNSTCEPEKTCLPYDNCPDNEELTDCGSTCDMQTGMCLFNIKCRPGKDCFDNGGEKLCNCKPGYIRYLESDMRCVSEDECKKERDDCWKWGCGSKCDYYDSCSTGRPCPFYDDPTCHHKGSEDETALHTCMCRPGHRRVIKKYAWTIDLLTCVPEDSCVPYDNCPEYEELTSCGSKCDHSDSCLVGQPCPDEADTACHPPDNFTVCNCIPGYRRYGKFGSCVPEAKCNKSPTHIRVIPEIPASAVPEGCYYFHEDNVACGKKSDITVQCSTSRPSPFIHDKECYPSRDMFLYAVCNCKEGFIRKRGYACSPISWCRPFIDTNCNENEKLVSCGSKCDHWDSCLNGEPCPHAADTSCWPADGVQVCNCKDGYTRYGALCVPEEDCESLQGICPRNEILKSCGNPCDVTICRESCWWSTTPCYPTSKKPVCNCQDSFVRESHSNPKCIPAVSCKGDGNSRLRSYDLWSNKRPLNIPPDAPYHRRGPADTSTSHRPPTRLQRELDWKRLLEGRRGLQALDDV